MSKESIGLLNSTNNIKLEKCELFHDYAQSLVTLIFDTYLGDDITSDVQKINHFRWCWYKNVENFMREGITIGGNKLYSYFLEFMQEHYYSETGKTENPLIIQNIHRLWTLLFDFNNPSLKKSKSDMDTFIDIYRLFDAALIAE